MSADNFILINRDTFEVFGGCASTGHTTKIGQGKTLEEAIDIAEDVEYPVEYGVHFTRKENGRTKQKTDT